VDGPKPGTFHQLTPAEMIYLVVVTTHTKPHGPTRDGDEEHTFAIKELARTKQWLKRRKEMFKHLKGKDGIEWSKRVISPPSGEPARVKII
jgi:hypothetical protein